MREPELYTEVCSSFFQVSFYLSLCMDSLDQCFRILNVLNEMVGRS